MYNIDFNKPLKIHFIGIGGIGMSGLAIMLLKKKFIISGSDLIKTNLTEYLKNLGCTIYYNQYKSNITNDIKLIIYTQAINKNNIELLYAKKINIPILSRSELLGQIMKNYKMPITISGTHGKTTTTAMLSCALLYKKKDPTILIGGMLKQINGNIRLGKTLNYFITEACEYKNSFLNFCPKISIILNIDNDHLDFFNNISNIRYSFKKFAKKIKYNGILIINSDIDNYQYIINKLHCKIITYGIKHNADYMAKNIVINKNNNISFDCIYKNNIIGNFLLNIPGIHNVSNALPVIICCIKLNFSIKHIQNCLLYFQGVNRRFQYKGKIHNIKIFDDYAHHPTEIIATLKTARQYTNSNLWCVFQPHTYSRIKYLINDFAKSLTLADKVIITDIYTTRENNNSIISSKKLYKLIINLGTEAYYFHKFIDIEQFLYKNCSKNDLLITIGAGDVYKISDNLLKKYNK